MLIYLYKSPIKGKKWRVEFGSAKPSRIKLSHPEKVEFPNGKTVDFGATGYSDYTLHKDADRKLRYIARHKAREDWTKSGGITTAGFWSRWILWNRPSLSASIKDTEKRFGLKIIKR